MRDFHMSHTQAMKYPLNQALALLAFTRLHNPACAMEIDELGYIAQETERRSASH